MRTAPSINAVVTHSKPDRLEDPDKFVADDFEDEDVEAAVKELGPICDEYRRRTFGWHYQLGKIVGSHYKAISKQRDNMYGTRFFNRLAQDLNRPGVSGQLLACCYRIVRQYEEAEYMAFVRRPEISPTHLIMLAGIEPSQERREFIQEVVDDKLTVRQLDATMKQRYGLRQAGMKKRGRPLMIPANVKAGLIHFDAQIDKFIRLNNDSWFGERFDLICEITKLTGDQLTDEFRAQLAAASEKSEQLAKVATQDAQALKQALGEVDCRRKRQAEVSAKVAAAEALENENGTVSATPQDRSASGRVSGRAIGVAT